MSQQPQAPQVRGATAQQGRSALAARARSAALAWRAGRYAPAGLDEVLLQAADLLEQEAEAPAPADGGEVQALRSEVARLRAGLREMEARLFAAEQEGICHAGD